TERYGTKMAEGSSVNDHVLKMINVVENLGDLGIIQDAELSTNLILHSLPPSFAGFITNFNMNRITATLADLLNMLREAEVNMYKGKSASAKGKAKSGKLPPRPASFKPGVARPPSQRKQQAVTAPDVVARVVPAEESTLEPPANGPWFYCGKPGHWKRNCVKFFKSIGKGMPYLSYIKVNMYIPDSSSRILDSAYGTHICSNL
ncbi:zf-CCHC domain-containing protein/UBN2_2 domain-containing protein, partial [Cephalotus follicularis]